MQTTPKGRGLLTTSWQRQGFSVFGGHLSPESLPKCSLMFQKGSAFIIHLSLIMGISAECLKLSLSEYKLSLTLRYLVKNEKRCYKASAMNSRWTRAWGYRKKCPNFFTPSWDSTWNLSVVSPVCYRCTIEHPYSLGDHTNTHSSSILTLIHTTHVHPLLPGGDQQDTPLFRLSFYIPKNLTGI